jgi:hypothetical protein
MWLSKKSLFNSNLRLRTLYLSIYALFFLVAVSCKAGPAAQEMISQKNDGAAEEEAMRLLPSAEETGDWQPTGNAESFSGEQLFDHIDGGADIYFEYGFATLITQQYKKDDKAVSVEVYLMDDPAAAYGIYSYNRHPSLSPVEVGSDATIHPNGLFFWQDKYYVDIRQMGAATILPDEFMALAKAISRKIGVTAERPSVMKRLPKGSMVPHSDVFARGKLAINNQVFIAEEDLFGLGKGEVAAIARYKIDQPEFSLVIAEYKSAETCENAFRRFRDHFLGSGSTKENTFAIQAQPGKYFAVRKMGNTLVVVANADSQKNAVEMFGRVSDSGAAK